VTTPEDLEMIRRIERLGEIQADPVLAARAIERARAAVVSLPPARLSFWSRRLPWVRVAAGIVLITCSVLVIGWLLSADSGGGSAFADVQEKVRNTRTLTFKMTRQHKGRAETERILIQAPNLLRVESAGAKVSIIDYEQRKWLAIDPAKKEATVYQGIGLAAPDIYGMLRNLQKDTIKRLPPREIDGKTAPGFLVPVSADEHRYEAAVWVDATTRLPVRLEVSGEDDEGHKSLEVMSDLVFDTALDPALFSLVPPKGFAVRTDGVAALPAAPEKEDMRAPVVTAQVGIGPARFGMTKEEVIRVLGQPDAIPAESRGTILQYFSRGFSLTFAPKRGLFWIQCWTQKAIIARVRDFKGKTREGIGMGSSAKDIERAYGKPDERETNGPATVYLRYRKLGLDFTLFSDKLVEFVAEAQPKKPGP
jgi:outer membrane lipoprotein-sorting protein